MPGNATPATQPCCKVSTVFSSLMHSLRARRKSGTHSHTKANSGRRPRTTFTSSPMRRSSIRRMSATTTFRSKIVGSTICLRLKVSSWRVSAAALLPALCPHRLVPVRAQMRRVPSGMDRTGEVGGARKAGHRNKSVNRRQHSTSVARPGGRGQLAQREVDDREDRPETEAAAQMNVSH
jgi:hypothetical protein